ncbi:MAG: diguanylate cyclase [Gemmatimonadota bacterium]
MPPQTQGPLVALLFGSVFYSVMAWVLLRHRRAHGAGPTAFAMGTCFTWVAGALASALATTFRGQLLAINVAYLGACFTPLAILVFVAFYTRARPIPVGTVARLAIVPLISALLIWTNPWHELMWAHPPMGPDGNLTIRADWGPWFTWMHVPYHWGLVTVAEVFLLRAALFGTQVPTDSGPRLGRLHAAALLLALTGTFVINIVTVVGDDTFRVSPTAIAIALSSVLFLWVFAQMELVPFRHVAQRRILNAMSDGVFVADERDVILELNPAACALVADPKHARIGARLSSVFGDEPAIQELFQLPGEIVEEVSTREGRRYEFHLSPVHDASGNHRGRTVLVRDVTDRRRQEATLKSIVDVSPNGILRIRPVRDASGIVDFECTFANPAAAAYLGIDQDALAGARALEALPAVGPQVLPILRRAVELGAAEQLEVPVQGEAEDPLWFRIFVSPVGNELTVTFVEITEERRRQQEMEEVAFYDPLTRLLNRRGLEREFGGIPLPSRRAGGVHTLLYMDLDRFKPVNDTYGHSAGDRLLKEFAARLRSATRQGDLLARIGGDEFVVLLVDVDSAAGRATLARVQEVTDAPYWLGGVTVSCRPSIGIAQLSERGSTLADALIAADHAMYLAKAAGGGAKTAAGAQLEPV